MTLSYNSCSCRLPFPIALVLLLVLQTFAQSPATTTLTVRDIMSEPSIAGMRPEGEKLSPDGKWVAYLWSAAGKEPRDLYLVATSGGGAAKILTAAVDTPIDKSTDQAESQDESRLSENKDERTVKRDAAQLARERSVVGIEWSPDSRRLLYSKQGDLYVLTIEDAKNSPRRLTQTIAIEGSARWLADSRRVLYQSGGNLFVIDVDQTYILQLTREGGAAAYKKDDDGTTSQQGTTGGASVNNTLVSGAQPSEDGTYVAYIVSDNSKQRALIVPNYQGEFVTAPTVRRGWSEQRVQIVKSDGSSQAAIVVKMPAAEGVSYIRGIRWAPDSKALVIDRIDRDTKRRQIYYVNAMDGASTLVDEEADAKWIASLSRIIEFSPNGDQLLFGSERDGFNHLYLAPVRGDKKVAARVRQVTKGNWEVNWAKWLPDGGRIIYSSTQFSTAQRSFQVIDEPRGNNTLILALQEGMNIDPQLSKSGTMLIYEHSKWNEPSDIYSLSIDLKFEEPHKLFRLTRTVPGGFNQIKWTQPQFVAFKTKDGKVVKARVYTPTDFDKKKKYPAVIFVHGAGYLQNVINGWNSYYREAMFNHILVQRGYVILDIDYRGSAGYGREWRTDVYDFLGGLDFQDHLDGIDFIVKNYAVDAARVGMYGGSYGGFMAEMAVMRAPEKVACAAALRPVADWKNYFASSPVYTTERLGFPDKNPEAYKRSSPITYADGLRSPLLILHGMVDDNVHFQDSIQLVEKLIKLGKTKYFEAMFYPTENHGFIRPESWTDEYERILTFFDTHLRPVKSKSNDK